MRVEYTYEDTIEGKKVFIQIDGAELDAEVSISFGDDVLFEGTPTEAIKDYARLLVAKRLAELSGQ